MGLRGRMGTLVWLWHNSAPIHFPLFEPWCNISSPAGYSHDNIKRWETEPERKVEEKGDSNDDIRAEVRLERGCRHHYAPQTPQCAAVVCESARGASVQYEDWCGGLTSSAPAHFHSAILVLLGVSRAIAAQPGSSLSSLEPLQMNAENKRVAGINSEGAVLGEKNRKVLTGNNYIHCLVGLIRTPHAESKRKTRLWFTTRGRGCQ